MVEKTEQQAIKDAYDSRVVQVRRTTTVGKGGRSFQFSAVVVVGDGNGRIGFASGKAKEVVTAVQKAIDQAKRNIVQIDLRRDTIQYPIQARYGATSVIMKPASRGTGIIAGGALRAVCEVGGIRNIIAKCIGSTNPLNVIKAAIGELKKMASPKSIAEKRDKNIKEILSDEN